MNERKIPEELIKRIAKDWDILQQASKHGTVTARRNVLEIAVVRAVNGICEAIESGQLELPNQRLFLTITPCFFDQVRKLGLENGDILIALRPQEEKK